MGKPVDLEYRNDHNHFHQPDGVIMSTFQVTVRTGGKPTTYPALAASAAQAAEDAAERFADVPCGITVTSGEVQ